MHSRKIEIKEDIQRQNIIQSHDNQWGKISNQKNPQIQLNDVEDSSLHIVTPCPLCLYWPWLLQGPKI
jgi:hypothetical protein